MVILKCPAITAKGKPCPIIGEESRNSWCHVHDPVGENQTRIRQVREHKAKNGGKSGIVNKKILAKEQQIKESIALDIEGLCYTLINDLCYCDFHRADSIARYGNL
jgi:hypothetical protein